MAEFTNTYEDRSYTLTKVDAGNSGKHLPGAVFTVYEYERITAEPETFGYVATEWTYTSDADGVISVAAEDHQFKPNTAYYLAETTAPTGYALNETKYPFWFYTEGGVTTAPEGFNDIALNLAQGGGSATVRDELTGIFIKKLWSPVPDGVDTITIDIKDKNGATVKTVSLERANGWEAAITDLPFGEDIEYTFEEQSVTGYNLASTMYKQEGRAGDYSNLTGPGTVTFTNISTSSSGGMDDPFDDKLPDAKSNKELVDLGDGTYKLTLSVTIPYNRGRSKNKANVVIVYDSSNSMNRALGYRKLNSYTTSQEVWGVIGGVPENSNHGDLTWDVVYSGNVGDEHTGYYIYDRQNGWVSYRPAWGFWVPDTEAGTRMTTTKTVVDSLGRDLLANNEAGEPVGEETVEVAFVEYATKILHTYQPTGNYTTFSGWVNSCSAPGTSTNDKNGATNWETALAAANNIQFGDDDPTYIIFLSDGNPTKRDSSFDNDPDDPDSNMMVAGTHGNGTTDPNGYNLLAAQGQAQQIRNANKFLFSFGIFGEAYKMQDLTPHDAYHDVSDANDLSTYFDEIVTLITTAVGYTDVTIEDGLTSMSSSTLVSGTASNFTYKVTDSAGNDVTASALAALGNPEAMYTENTVIAADGTPYTQKEIVWDLGGQDLLIEGGTYSVSFIVWPNQEAYDLVADLNNGKRSYDALNDVEKAQVTLEGGVYKLRTNTHEGAHGKTATQKNDDPPVPTSTDEPIDMEKHVDPMPLTDARVKVQKRWQATLDTSQLRDIIGSTVVLDLYKETGKYIEGISISKPDEITAVPAAVLSSGEWTWEETGGPHNVSAGMMVSTQMAAASGLDVTGYPTTTYEGTTYHILEPGRDYSFIETSGGDKHFELEEMVFHPMVVNGMLNDVIFNADGSVQSMTPAAVDNTVTVTAVNKLKGGIRIYKEVYEKDGTTKDDDDDTPFTVKVTMTNPDNTPYNVTAEDGGWRLNYGPNNPNKGEAYYEGGVLINYGREANRHAIANGEFTATLYPGDYIQVANVNSGVTYTVQEINVPLGYAVMEIEGASSTVQTETSHQVTVKNKKVDPTTGNLNITKAVAEGADATGKTFTFEVTLTNADNSAYTGNVKVIDSARPIATDVTPDASGKVTVTVSGTGTATISEIPDGTKYEVTEKDIPTGWSQTGAVAITGGDQNKTITAGEIETATVTNMQTTDFSFTKVWYDESGNEVDWVKDIAVTLYSTTGGSQNTTVATFTLNSNGGTAGGYTWTAESVTEGGVKRTRFTITGLPALSGGSTLSYYVKETKVDGYMEPVYAIATSGNAIFGKTGSNADRAENGQFIQNRPEFSVELPSTGGPGTGFYQILGFALIAMAATLLLLNRKRRGEQ